MTVKNTLQEFKQNTWDKLDETILKQYTRLTKKWEEKGHSRYSLANAFSLSTFPFIHIIGNYYKNYDIVLTPVSGIMASDVTRNLLDPFFKKEDITSDGTTAKDSNMVRRIFEKLAEWTRLPLFLSGAGLMAKGGMNLVDYFQTQNSNSLNDALNDLSLGYTLFGTASSMYIKESDPRLLDKAPMWKKAYESLKEKAKELLPQPMPNPAPAAVNRSLEGIVN